MIGLLESRILGRSSIVELREFIHSSTYNTRRGVRNTAMIQEGGRVRNTASRIRQVSVKLELEEEGMN